MLLMNPVLVVLLIIIAVGAAILLWNAAVKQTNSNNAAYQQCLDNCQTQNQACQAQYGQNSVMCEGQLGICNTACSF